MEQTMTDDNTGPKPQASLKDQFETAMRAAMSEAVVSGLPMADVLAVAQSVVIEDVTGLRGRREMELYLAGVLGAEVAADYRAASLTGREELDRHTAELIGAHRARGA
jgi:hypothetical protein